MSINAWQRGISRCCGRVSKTRPIKQGMAGSGVRKVELKYWSTTQTLMPGQMLNLWSSPGDPLFYLHHTYLDKLWWQWQANDLTPRLKDITGSNQPMSFEFIPGSPSNDSCQPLGILTPSAEVHKIDGDPGNVTTLGHVLTTFGMLPNVTIADVMDIQCGLLCYEYI
jgi:tyrosinase